MFASSVFSSLGTRAVSSGRCDTVASSAPFSKTSGSESEAENQDAMGSSDAYHVPEAASTERGCLTPGLYLVATPIGNLEDITLRGDFLISAPGIFATAAYLTRRHDRKLQGSWNAWKVKHSSDGTAQGSFLKEISFGDAQWKGIVKFPAQALRVLKSVDVILAEDTRHSRKLLQHFCINTPLLSFHKFNETQRETKILARLRQGHLVAMISDAGTPGISDPGMELVKSCVSEGIPVVPIPGASALLTALSASGLSTDEFTFVGFLPKHAGSRRERLTASANEKATQVFFVPPHKLHQFLQEASLLFGDSRYCVIAREMTKIHEEFWRGTLGSANKVYLDHQPKGEITVLIEGKKTSATEIPTETELESNLRYLISSGHSLSEAVKLVAEGTSSKKKQVYSLALKIFGKQTDAEHPSG